jgi:hypothetical protein
MVGHQANGDDKDGGSVSQGHLTIVIKDKISFLIFLTIKERSTLTLSFAIKVRVTRLVYCEVSNWGASRLRTLCPTVSVACTKLGVTSNHERDGI